VQEIDSILRRQTSLTPSSESRPQAYHIIQHVLRSNNQHTSANSNTFPRRPGDPVFLLLVKFERKPKQKWVVSEQFESARSGCGTDTADVSTGVKAEYHVGFAEEWWECCSYHGEDIEWARVGSCELSCHCYFRICLRCIRACICVCVSLDANKR
jgi:hypothetical protein